MNVGVPKTPEDRVWLRDLWVTEWGGDTMISQGQVYHLASLEALVAKEREALVGAVTWAIDNQEAELVSLNAVIEDRGIGSALLEAAEREARKAGVRRMHLITSNDNLRALAFYQKRGYRIEALFPGAVDRARQEKPSIPLVAENGIPIHDELLLAKLL